MPVTIELPTVKVTARIYDQSGNPADRAEIFMRLSTTERYGAYIVPREVRALTDANGQAVLEVFPNELGSEGSEYHVRITFSDSPGVCCGGQAPHTSPMRTISGHAVVPNSDCNLQDIMELPAYGPRGTGQVITAEVAGYASAAASYADASKSYMEAAQSVETRVNAAADAAEAAKTASREAAATSADQAVRAAELVREIEDTVAGFQEEVIGQVQNVTNQLTAQANAAITVEKAAALDAIEARSGEELQEISVLGAQIKQDALTSVNEAGAREVQNVGDAAASALEEIREEAALFTEDLEGLTEQAKAAAGRAGCSARAAEQSAIKACLCADAAQTAADDVKKALAAAAAELIDDDIINAAVGQATEAAEDAATRAEESAQSAAGSAAAALDAVTEIHDLTFEAETLAPGSQATAVYDPETRVVTVGLPKGEKGDDGDTVIELSDSVTSDSSSTAASSKAVKTAYDAAAAAQTTAGSALETANAALPATGTAAAATKLATARSIALSGKVTGTATPFDGSGNVTIPVTAVTADSCTGNAATADSCTGNAATATTASAWTTARTLALTGAVTGSASIKGDADVSLVTTLVETAWAKPQNAAGVGQWTEAYGVGVVDLPSGGTWAYDLQMMTGPNLFIGVAAGGTVIGPTGTDVLHGLIWRIA